MRAFHDILLMTASAAMLWLMAACAGGSDTPPGPGPESSSTNLVLDLRVGGAPASRTATAADRLPAGDWELMHTLRIIIFASDGHVEYNGRYDLSSPVVQHQITITVQNAEAKKIIFIANEDHFTVLDPLSGTSVPASDYFSGLYATVSATPGNTFTGNGWTTLFNTVMITADNPVFASDQLRDKTRIPVPASAVYENVVIPKVPEYSRTFYLHRAAAKYTYRLTNESVDGAVIIDKARITHVAARQYLFYHGTYADSDTRKDLAVYEPLSLSATQRPTAEYGIDHDVDFGKTVEISPIYLPEGSVISPDSYKTNLSLNGKYAPTADGADNHVIQTGADDVLAPGTFAPMTTLPRNTNVIVNGSFKRESQAALNLSYTICPWYVEETDIPPYN